MTDDSTSWGDHVGYIRESYVDGLVRRGLRLIQEESAGADSRATLVNDDITVTLGEGFPYLPPRVTLNRDVPRSWHQEHDGGLCLYTSSERNRMHWLDPDAFLARVQSWFKNNEQGWPNDPPALDVEAYLELPWDTRFVIYNDLDRSAGGYVTLRCDGNQLRVSGPGKAPRKRTRELTGYVADIGPLDEPPRNWNEIVSRCDGTGALSSELQRGQIDVLLIRYARSLGQGVLAVTYTLGKRGRQPHIARSASTDRSVLGLRAGPAFAALDNKHVYVIGAGSLGSHICDGLSRAGVGRLTVRDSDYLTPGNMTRHLVTDIEHCGAPKAQAVKRVLDRRPYNRAHITDINDGLVRPGEAAKLFEQCDLVLDATADGAATAMLEHAARVTGHRFLTVCLQNEGRTQRLDVIPPLWDTQPIAPTRLVAAQSPEIFEAGCGDPVSMTPPFAVAEAAAMAVRHIVGHLTGQPPASSGEVRDYV